MCVCVCVCVCVHARVRPLLLTKILIGFLYKNFNVIYCMVSEINISIELREMNCKED